MMFSPRFSTWYSRMRVSTIESTGQALLAEAAEDALEQVDVVARRAARAVGALTSDSMVIASAGHTASHSLQAMQRSSPFG